MEQGAGGAIGARGTGRTARQGAGRARKRGGGGDQTNINRQRAGTNKNDAQSRNGRQCKRQVREEGKCTVVPGGRQRKIRLNCKKICCGMRTSEMRSPTTAERRSNPPVWLHGPPETPGVVSHALFFLQAGIADDTDKAAAGAYSKYQRLLRSQGQVCVHSFGTSECFFSQ